MTWWFQRGWYTATSTTATTTTSSATKAARTSQQPQQQADLAMVPPSSSSSSSKIDSRMVQLLEDRMRSSLWSYFAGDALAMPTHWFYGGLSQIRRYYGHRGIVGYVQPVHELHGSILNKSNLNGAGRSTSTSSYRGNGGKTIIGDVINHGKQDLWDPNRQVHYHATLHAGENTLEVQLGRVLMRSIVDCHGRFDADHFRRSYVEFMTTPNSHHDTYASTCHRMFFSNLVHRKLPPEQCPDNDQHNVETIDGLVLPTLIGIATAGHPDGTAERAHQDAAHCVSVIRKSKRLERAASAWATSLFHLLRRPQLDDDNGDGIDIDAMQGLARQTAKELGLRTPNVRTNGEEMTACYLDSALPALLDSIMTQSEKKRQQTMMKTSSESGVGGEFWVFNALLENANCGGENVHRGSCLGAWLGASATPPIGNTDNHNKEDSPTTSPSSSLIQGLHDRVALREEIDAFIKAIMT